MKNSKYLLTGANGQLGLHLQKLLKGEDVLPTDAAELDITKPKAVKEYVQKHKPDVILNCAAYNLVDKAEEEPIVAFGINALGPWNLARAAKAQGALFVHVSTDFVFDGTKTTPYTEDDQPNPLSAYGQSKYAGETLVQNTGGHYFLVRTAWLYGDEGKNFPSTILKKATSGEPLAIVNDQFGSPTYAKDLAEAIIKLLKTDKWGLYHGVNSGHASWYDVARVVLASLRSSAPLAPQTSKEAAVRYPAPRPHYSVLDSSKLQLVTGYQFRPWQEALQEWLRHSNEK